MRCEPQTSSNAAHYHQALALAEEIGMRPLQAHCHHGLGTLCTGRTAGAGAGQTLCRHDAVPRYGHDLLDTPGGDSPDENKHNVLRGVVCPSTGPLLSKTYT